MHGDLTRRADLTVVAPGFFRFLEVAPLEGTLTPYSGNIFLVRWKDRTLDAALNSSPDALDQMKELLSEAKNDPLLTGIRQNSLDDNPTLQVNIDQQKVGALGIPQAQVDQTLTAAWGGAY